MRLAPGRTLVWLRTSARMIRRGALRSLVLRSLSVAYAALGLDRWYGRVLLFSRDVTASPPAIGADLPLELRDLTEDEIGGFCRARPDVGEADVRRRLDAGYRCLVSRSGERIVGEIWLVTGEVWHSALKRPIRLAPSDVYVYNSFVIPELRGRNLGTARSRLLGERLCAEGYRRMVYTVAPHNRPGLGPSAKLGAERLGSLGYVRVGSLQLDFARLHEGGFNWTRRGRAGTNALSLPTAS